MKIKKAAHKRRMIGMAQGKPYIIPGTTRQLITETMEELEDAENYSTDAIKKSSALIQKCRLIIARELLRMAHVVLPRGING